METTMDEVRLSTEEVAAVDNAIRLYFQPLRDRLKTVGQFISERRYSHEVILLLCTYLDALAATIFGNNTPSAEARLGAFLATFSSFGQRWGHISLPDFYNLLVHAELWTNLYFSQLALRPPQSTLEQSLKTSGFNLKDWRQEEDVGRFLKEISIKLASLGKVTAAQEAGTGMIEETTLLFALGPRLAKALKPLIERFRVSSVLYRNLRCSSVHELHLPTWLTEEDSFWNGHQPYFMKWKDELVFGNDIELLTLAFPARFLLKTCEECIERVHKTLLTTRKIPVDIWYDTFLKQDIYVYGWLSRPYADIPYRCLESPPQTRRKNG
jgi:hypothetical protein